jgi:hypothetical protein
MWLLRISILSSLAVGVFHRFFTCDNAYEIWKTIIEQNEGFVRTQNWHVLSDQSDLWVPPVRPVWSKTTKYNLDFTTR